MRLNEGILALNWYQLKEEAYTYALVPKLDGFETNNLRTMNTTPNWLRLDILTELFLSEENSIMGSTFLSLDDINQVGNGNSNGHGNKTH